MTADQPLRCARCGIESLERTCFVAPAAPASRMRCVTCAQRKSSSLRVRGLVALLAPAAALAVEGRPLWELCLVTLLVPAALMAHELGHALAALLLGMELGAVDIGNGPVVLRLRLGAVTIRLHAIPLSGRVFVGVKTLHMARTRWWITILMGPLTNGALVVLSLLWLQPWEALIGAPMARFWVLANIITLIGSLVPMRTAAAGQIYRSDGLQLITIPSAGAKELATLQLSALAARAQAGIEREDFAAVERWLLEAGMRVPAPLWVTVSLAGSQLSRHADSRGITGLLLPHREAAAAAEPYVRAAFYGNLAIALVITNIQRGSSEADLEEADRLSWLAFSMFPCVLAFRTGRALVLSVRKRAAEALPLLDYVNYKGCTRRECAWHQLVCAVAASALGRTREAAAAAERALQRHAASRRLLESFGVACAAQAGSGLQPGQSAG